LTLTKDLSDNKTNQFTVQFDMYYSLIFSTIYSRISNFHEAEDICQEVFLRFFKKFDEIKNPHKLLFGTLRIVTLEYFKEKYKKDINLEDIFEDISINFVNGFKDTRLIIEQALEHIYGSNEEEENEEKIIFDLIAIHSFTFTQASKHLNITYKRVRNSFRKTLRKLYNYLNNIGINSLGDLL